MPPQLNLTVLNPATIQPVDFASICSIMGIKTIATVTTPPVAPTTTIAFIKEDNKIGKAEVNLSSFYKELLVNGNIGRKTLEVENLQEWLIFAQAFLKASKKSVIRTCAKAMKTAWTAIIDPGGATSWAVQDLWQAPCSKVSPWPTSQTP